MSLFEVIKHNTLSVGSKKPASTVERLPKESWSLRLKEYLASAFTFCLFWLPYHTTLSFLCNFSILIIISLLVLKVKFIALSSKGTQV